MDTLDLDKIDKLIDDKIKKRLPEYLKTSAFTDRKLTDTPTDDLMVTPRKYVNMNGSVAGRPNSSIATIGQRYFASDTKILMTYDGTNWYNGAASIVAAG